MCEIHGLREEKRQVTLRMGENEAEIDCVRKERKLMVYSKCEGNSCGASTCISDSRY